jgi:hypothetical protein
MSAVATVLLAIVAMLALPPLGATGVLLILAWLFVAADHPRVAPRLALLPQAAAVLAFAAGKWAVADTLLPRLAPGWSATHYAPLLNPQMLLGVLLAGSIVAMYRLRRDRVRDLLARLSGDATRPAVLVLMAVSALITFALTMEVDRAVAALPDTAWPQMQVLQMAWTMLWSGVAAAYLFLHVRLDPSARSRRDWRAGAWALAGLLAIKFFLVDTLFWWFGGHAPASAIPLFNLQTVTAAAVVGALLLVNLILRRGGSAQHNAEDDTGVRVALAALAVLMWAGTLEIDRLVASGAFPGLTVWPKWQVRQFAWTAWWTAGAAGFLAVAHLRDRTALLRHANLLRPLAAVPVVLAAKYLLLDTLFYRFTLGHPAPALVVANLQTFCGAIVFAALVLVRYVFIDAAAAAGGEGDGHLFRRAAAGSFARALRAKKEPVPVLAGAAAVAMLLWLGSLEIDRAFLTAPALRTAFAQPGLAEQVALSIFWSAFAIASIVAGFATSTAGLRYFGLALFALTLLKVAVVDLSGAETGYRILSFTGLCSLLLVTSVIYGKLTPKLLKQE